MKTLIKQYNHKLENYSGRLPERLTFFLFLTLTFIVSLFHEPCFDEAVAWQIARNCSLNDILFYVPHYEGHPPLWHLILLPFAKLGAPYELSLTIISLTFAGLAVALMLRYAPFPRMIKLLLPFTYFFGYQYSVISRPYCVMILAFVLLALSYPKRNEKSIYYVLSLILLCATSAYGIVIAGGLAIVWLLEIWNHRNLFLFIKEFVHDKRFWELFILLIWAFTLILMFLPYKDTFSDGTEVTFHLFQRLLYTLLVVPADVTCSSIYHSISLLRTSTTDNFSLFCGCILGIIILSMIFYYARKKKTTLLFVIPYTLWAVFASIVYMYLHHMGVALLFLLFWLWVSMESPETESIKSLPLPPEITKGAHIISVGLLVYMMCMSLFWTGCAYYNEIRYPYSGSRDMADFIKENNLNEYQLYACCTIWEIKDSNGIKKINDINHSGVYALLPYFESNIAYNGPFGTDGNYTLHKIPTDDEIARTMQEWKTLGYPDVIIGHPDLSIIFGEEITIENDYTLVYKAISRQCWKEDTSKQTNLIYVRNDLLEELHLKPYTQEDFFDEY